MSELYSKIWRQAHQEIYSFIKMTKMKAENYTFENYFNFIVEKNKIKVMPHHFENDLILGITMIDKLGTSISYESSNIETRQNFTMCHELGHLILNHNGGVFTELQKNHTPIELEADFFASIIMAPDIVLLYKILYQRTSFKQLTQDLEMSNQALTIRLNYFLQTYSTKTKTEIYEIVDHYRRHTNSKNFIVDLLCDSKDFIIRNYQNISIDETELIDYYINKYEFFTSQDLPILSKKQIQKTIKQKYPKYSTWAYYDKGKTTWYTWNTTKFSQEDAYMKAKSLHILE